MELSNFTSEAEVLDVPVLVSVDIASSAATPEAIAEATFVLISTQENQCFEKKTRTR